MSRKPYIREMSKTNWFFSQPRYMRYMAREVTCIFILAYTILLIFALKNLAEGPEAYAAFLEALNSPQAMPIQRGEEFVPGNVIIGAHYGGWALVSLIVLFLGV